MHLKSYEMRLYKLGMNIRLFRTESNRQILFFLTKTIILNNCANVAVRTFFVEIFLEKQQFIESERPVSLINQTIRLILSSHV